MAAFTHFSKNLFLKTIRPDKAQQINNKCAACMRLLSYSSKEYTDNPDPSPIFIKPKVQSLLKTLTRVDLAKVYRKRKLGSKNLSQPIYQFMTDEQLEESLREIKQKVDQVIQIPPIVSVQKPIDKVLFKDPALQGLDTATLVFTDITFGVRDSERLIVVRSPDGTLKHADWNVRSRMNQVYYPIKDRLVKIPKMFTEDHLLEDVLNRHDYEFVLDRACIQFEPNDALYQKITSVAYQHVNDNNKFDLLRSTRHFGSLTFFLVWNKMADNLLLDLIETGNIDEASALVELYCQVHGSEIKAERGIKSVEEFIKEYATKRGALELAIQAYKDVSKQREELEQKIKRAHGQS